MLVVFEIDDNEITPERAAQLAERETLWCFSKEWRVYQAPKATIDKVYEFITTDDIPKPTKRTIHRKPTTNKLNGS